MALLKLHSEMSPLPAFLAGASLEVMPRTAEKIADFRAILPAGTQVFVAHIDGTPVADMQSTVARLSAEGMVPVPHVPARLVRDCAALQVLVAGYRAAGARQALLLGGGVARPAGKYHESLQLLDSGLFDAFDHIFVAGHPEGSRDIDPQGSDTGIMAALKAKQAWSRRSNVPMTIVTQFLFEAQPAIDWTDRLAAQGIDLPVRIGVAGPAKLQTMIRFAVACGVGASLRVLQRRSRDLTRLLQPVTPDQLLLAFARHKADNPGWAVEGAHLFPLGGIGAATDWLAAQR